MKRMKLGLVVPALELGGGVPTVAMFVHKTALAAGYGDVRVVSLATASDDGASLRASCVASWRGHPKSIRTKWSNGEFQHVGAVLPEFEFQRYRPRTVLAHALSNCDLIQVVCGSPAWANAVIGLGKPVALQVATRARVERRRRDAMPLGLAGWWRKGMTEITDRMDDRALRGVDAIQVENSWMLDYVRKVTAGRQLDIRYAPPGIDSRLFSPLPVNERLQDPYILCVARLSDPRKNVSLLLEAYAQLPAALRGRVRLVLAGSSAPPPEFWARADALGLYERISYIEKPDGEALLKLYQRASVFVLPSDEEGFGMVVIEAMACGVPVISTRSGGPDRIITDGSDGYLVPLDDATALGGRLARLLQDPAHNQVMGHAARLTIERRYDERIAGEVFLDMWDRMAHKGKAG